MKLLLAYIILLLPFLAFSQATSLKVNVNDCDGPASGTISLFKGDSMIKQEALRSGSVDFELNKATAISHLSEPKISVYPVPCLDGRIYFDLGTLEGKNARIDFFNPAGQLLGSFHGSADASLRLAGTQGFILYTIKADTNHLKSGGFYSATPELNIGFRFGTAGPGLKAQTSAFKSTSEAYIIEYKNSQFTHTHRDTFTIPAGSHKEVNLEVCSEDDSLYILPNIVIILADDLGYGSVGAYGANQNVIQTPCIDSLAKEGRLFTSAYTPSSVCSPTRYGMLTGRYDWRTGMEYGVLGVRSSLHINKERATLASLFKNAGYHTAAIGKWHLGYQEERVDYYKKLSPGPMDLGFDYHWGVPTNHGDVAGVWIENDSVYGLVENMEDLPPELRQPEFNSKGKKMLGIPAPYRTEDMEMSVVTQKAVDWIHDQSGQEPFFLYYAQTAIHSPLVTSPEFEGSSGGGVYGDFIQELDFCVGEVLKAIDSAGFRDNTLVLFTSDNGGHPSGGSDAIDAGLKINGDLRGTKLTIWDGGFKVPYILRWPERIPSGTVSDEMISLLDTYASLSSLLGVELPEKEVGAEDSYNVLHAWMAQDFLGPLRESTVLTSHEGITALRKGKWKYVEGYVPDPNPEWLTGKRLEEANEMLYDLDADPGEQHNVLSQYPDIQEEMILHLSRIRSQGYSRSK